MDSDSSKRSFDGQSKAREEGSNPFIAFRRYADAQVSSLLQSVIGLPSALSTQTSTSKRMGILDDPPAESPLGAVDHSAWEERKGREQQTPGLTAAIPVSVYRQGDHAKDDLSTEGDQKGHISQILPRIIDFPFSFTSFPTLHEMDFDPFNDQTFPRDYLAFSTYSPLYLERQYPLRNHQEWRDAFEDLLLELGGDDECGWKRTPEGEEPHDWLLRMGRMWSRQPRENLSDYCQAMRAHFGLVEDDAPQVAEDDAQTELDLYEWIARQRRHQQQQQQQSSPSASQPSQPTTSGTSQGEQTGLRGDSIISTLTTTERTTAPDGTVHTKMVLKKRFADGREESSETLQTTAGPPAGASSAKQLPSPASEGEKNPASRQEQSKAKGWFWS